MKKILYTLAAIIFAPLIILLIVLHLCVYPIVVKIRRKKREENKYWNECVKQTPRLSVFLTTSRDLMLSFTQYYEGYNYDDEIRNYSRELVIHFGGMCIFWKYGHKFLKHVKNSDVEGRAKYYGLYCIDGWRGCWDCLWWGTHLYDNPFMYRTHLATEVFNFDTLELEDVRLFRKYEDMYDETRKPPVYKTLEHAKYNSKSCGKQDIDWIQFTVTQMRYTTPLLHWLGLDRLSQKKHVTIDWECSPPGIGSGRGSWKGACYGSGIKLTKDEYKHVLKLYDNVTVRNMKNDVSHLKYHLDRIIDKFMKEDKQF